MLLATPFHARTQPLNEAQVWRRWSGYMTAGAYELSHEREYWAVRNSAALFDVSPLHKYHISGRDAARLLDRMVTRDVSKLAVGERIVFGAVVELCDADSGDECRYQIVGDLEADIRLGLIAITSPVARALIGRQSGDSVEIAAPGGVREYEIISVRYGD